MMWAGNVARRRGRRVHTELWRGLLKERDQLEDIGLEERIILRLIFNPWATNVIYIYRAPMLDVSRSHTTTQHSR